MDWIYLIRGALRDAPLSVPDTVAPGQQHQAELYQVYRRYLSLSFPPYPAGSQQPMLQF